MGRLSVTRGCHCHSRAACSTAATALSTPTSGAGAPSTHSARVAAVTVSSVSSNLRDTLMTRPGVTFLVNMGTTRPVITHITMMTSASCAYSGATAGTAMAPSTDRWNTRLAMDISTSSDTSGMLRLLPDLMSTRSSTRATAGSKAMSSPMNTGYGATSAAMRAATHTRARVPSSGPRAVSSPVQALTAVSRKPAITPAAKPNSISCPCHSRGESSSFMSK